MPVTELTSRETEVLGLIAVGHTAPEISARLNLAVRTVQSHRANGFRKLGITSTAEVVAWARHNGQLLSDEQEWNSVRFLLTVRQSPLMVLVTDAEMRFFNASHAALRELGYSFAELLELSVPDIVVDRTDAEERYENYRLTGTQNGTITLRRKDGSAFGAGYSASIRHFGDEQHYVSVLVPEQPTENGGTVTYTFQLVSPDGEILERFHTSEQRWQAGDVVTGHGSRRLRVVSVIPVELMAEFIDKPAGGVLEVEPL